MPAGTIKGRKAKGPFELPDGTKAGKKGDQIFEIQLSGKDEDRKAR